MFPVNNVFEWDKWQDGFNDYWSAKTPEERNLVREDFREFKTAILENFKSYDVPVIALDKNTSREAVCVVFEKVNTGGKPLDAFELVTAMYAVNGHELRADWFGKDGKTGRQQKLATAFHLAGQKTGVLDGVSSTDFLHVVSLFHTRDRRREAEKCGKSGKELPQITGNRTALLELPLASYLKYEDRVELGFMQAAKFLHKLHIYRIYDLPYQTQIVALAAIFAELAEFADHGPNHAKIVQWYWNGVFGELYGSAVETRIARDFVEVPEWLKHGVHYPRQSAIQSFVLSG